MPDDTTSAAAPAMEAATSPALDSPAAPTSEAVAPNPAAPAKAMTFEEAADAVDFTKMSEAEFAAFEAGDLTALGTPAASQPEKKDEPEKFSSHEEPGARLQAALAATTPEEIEAAGVVLQRVSIKGLKASDRTMTVKALDLIRAGQPPAEAFAAAFGITGQPAAPAATGEQPGEEAATPAPAAQTGIPELEAQLATLQQKYNEAKDLYDPSAPEIMEQMRDVKMDLRDARRDAAAKQAAYDQQETASHNRALDLFSDLLTDTSSGFEEHCNDEILLAQFKKDPIIFQPDWPEKIGRRVIDKFFKGKGVKNSEPVEEESQAIPPAPRQSVRLPGSPVGPGFSAGALSPQTAMAEIDKLTPEQQDAFINSLDKLTSPHRRTVHDNR